MDRLMRENSQPFVLHRDGERVGEVEGVKGQGKINFGPGVEVFVADWLEDVKARAWLHVTDVNHGKLANRVIIQVKYETRQQRPQPTQQFTFNAPAYGTAGGANTRPRHLCVCQCTLRVPPTSAVTWCPERDMSSTSRPQSPPYPSGSRVRLTSAPSRL